MTIDTRTLDFCECTHIRGEHRWYFWPAEPEYGQCWHGAHGIDGTPDCTCSGFELAETHGDMPEIAPGQVVHVGDKLVPGWYVFDGNAVQAKPRLNPGAEHVHRYDRGHIECNRTPACTPDPVPAAVVTAAKAALSPEDEALRHAYNAVLTERVNAHTCWCHHRRDEHDTTTTGKQGACTYGRYSLDGNTCPCTEYELADSAPDLIENLCDVVDAFFVRNEDDADLIRRARRWLTTHDEGARGD